MGLYRTMLHLTVCAQLTRREINNMAAVKTATLTLCIDPGLKEALRTAAQRDHGSIAKLVDVPIAISAAGVGS